MKSAPALGSESTPRRAPAFPLHVSAGVLAGILTAGIITVVSSRRAAPVVAATVAATPDVAAPLPIESSAAPVPPEPLDLAEMRRREVQAHHAVIARHMREPGDATWAPESEKRLRAFLSPLAAREKFRVVSVDCRTTSCVAELSFPSYAAAQSKWRSVLNAHNPVGCGTQIALEEPHGEATGHELSVVYDCTEVRHAMLGVVR